MIEEFIKYMEGTPKDELIKKWNEANEGFDDVGPLASDLVNSWNRKTRLPVEEVFRESEKTKFNTIEIETLEYFQGLFLYLNYGEFKKGGIQFKHLQDN